MEGYNCSYGCKGSCIIELVLSIIAGVVVGILFANEIITASIGFVIVSLIIAALGLATLLGSLFSANLLNNCNSFKKCICKNATCLLVAGIGGLIAGTIALFVDLATAAIASILVVAFITFFFIWTILSIFSLILCLIKETCK